MIRNKSEKDEKRIEIDLTGPEGNSFYLIGVAVDLAKKLSYTKQDISEIVHEMTSRDYEHLIKVFDEYFGNYVILWR